MKLAQPFLALPAQPPVAHVHAVAPTVAPALAAPVANATPAAHAAPAPAAAPSPVTLQAVAALATQAFPAAAHHLRGAAGGALCGGPACRQDGLQALLLFLLLLFAIAAVLCSFMCLRTADEQTTPLCPQLVVTGLEMRFSLPLTPQLESFEIASLARLQPLARVEPGEQVEPGQVPPVVRIKSPRGGILASVVTRGGDRGPTLCRGACEIYGFVEPDGKGGWYVRHRSSAKLLTLRGDPDTPELEVLNTHGAPVCWFKGGEGRALEHVDVGLAVAALLAIRLQQALRASAGEGKIALPMQADQEPAKRAPQLTSPSCPPCSPHSDSSS